MELLDEVGNADVADLLTVKNFIVHFQLKAEADCVDDPVPVEIEALGDDTYEMLRERVYPVYSKVSAEIVDACPATAMYPKRCAILRLRS
jgi:hypothetical protein